MNRRAIHPLAIYILFYMYVLYLCTTVQFYISKWSSIRGTFSIYRQCHRFHMHWNQTHKKKKQNLAARFVSKVIWLVLIGVCRKVITCNQVKLSPQPLNVYFKQKFISLFIFLPFLSMCVTHNHCCVLFWSFVYKIKSICVN